jgi:hypothetical protein
MVSATNKKIQKINKNVDQIVIGFTLDNSFIWPRRYLDWMAGLGGHSSWTRIGTDQRLSRWRKLPARIAMEMDCVRAGEANLPLATVYYVRSSALVMPASGTASPRKNI